MVFNAASPILISMQCMADCLVADCNDLLKFFSNFNCTSKKTQPILVTMSMLSTKLLAATAAISNA